MTQAITPKPMRKTDPFGDTPRKRSAKPKAVTKGTEPIPRDGLALPETPAKASAPKGPTGKLGLVAALLARPEGATIAQISAVTDWQPHSVRGAIAGALKQKHGLAIVSEPADGGRVYRLGGGAA